MTSSFDPSLRYCWTIVAIGGWGGGPGHRKAIVMAELKPDEEFMVVEALYPLCGAGTPRCPARVRKFSRHTIRQMEISQSGLKANPAIPICRLLALMLS